ncbi:CvpA family protein [Clostridium formicaceticum]|uniref:Colicin V production protein n=1 Tax=Clostridium formicaceticum TaxID=1497 RepID=A0AAC9RS24_9CLOT|nr:CvpA family protein [Clostridium formicaceticum]AOY75398.1 hypothetical protein BJL90_05465 [Clostridium formicaceticum]ARE89853.1 Colicin V production protein [Clostridium formicaceticum]
MEMKWFDALIIVILLVNTIIGYKRGLVLTLFSLGSYIVAVLVTKTYYLQLATWIKNFPLFIHRIQPFVESQVGLRLSTILGLNHGTLSEKLIEEVELPSFIQDYLLKEASIETYAQQTAEIVKEHFQDMFVNFFVNVISIVALFILIRMLVLLIGYLLNGVFQIPVLGAVNKLGGGFLGALKGGILMVVIVLVMTMMAMINLEGTIAKGMNESVLLPILSDFFSMLY